MRVYACPCEWSTDWANRGREAVMAWRITSGEYDGVPLAGLRMAAVVVGSFTLTEASTARQSALFVDAAAPAGRQRAGVAWLRKTYAPLLGEVAGVHLSRIEFVFEQESASVRIDSILSLAMRRAHFPQDTQAWAQLTHDPFIPLESPAVGVTTHVSYSGPDLNTRWTREEDALTGYFGTFTTAINRQR